MKNRRTWLRVSWLTLLGASALVAACGWDPSHPFEREAPPVKEAIVHLGDGGDAAVASTLLEDYLSTGVCKESNIGTPPRLRERPNGTFDLGLGLFRIGEAFGRKFGEEEFDAGYGTVDPTIGKLRQEQVDCALRIVRAVADDPDQPVDLRARARYLEGNLLFLTTAYDDAVHAYDKALELAPGMTDAGPIGASDGGRTYSVDLIGRDAAWNRAIALRRIEDKKDSGNDAAQDSSNDSGGDGGGNDDKNDKDGGKDSGGGQDSGKDSGGQDASKDSGAKPEENNGGDKQTPPQPKPDEPKEPPPRSNQDERVLEQFEHAPTMQQEAAKKQAHKVRGMADK